MKLFFSVCIIIFLFSKAQQVKAAKCFKSKIGWWRCSPCGQGTRCALCQWCLGYCYNQKTSKQSRQNESDLSPQYGNTTVPYKKPFIEMFGDLKQLIINDEISVIDVVELYKVTYFALREDCVLCSNNKEIEKLRDQTKRIHWKLKRIMKSENITILDDYNPYSRTSSVLHKFKKIALKSTRKSLKTTDDIPANLTAKVDSISPIALPYITTTTKSSTSIMISSIRTRLSPIASPYITTTKSSTSRMISSIRTRLTPVVLPYIKTPKSSTSNDQIITRTRNTQ